MKRRHYDDFGIAGFTYWDGAIAFAELTVGAKLTFVREENNKFDPYAVAIYYNDYKLGFVPRGENHEISKLCEQGYCDIFDIRINRITPDALPENQIGVVVYLKNRKDIEQRSTDD